LPRISEFFGSEGSYGIKPPSNTLWKNLLREITYNFLDRIPLIINPPGDQCQAYITITVLIISTFAIEELRSIRRLRGRHGSGIGGRIDPLATECKQARGSRALLNSVTCKTAFIGKSPIGDRNATRPIITFVKVCMPVLIFSFSLK
jgi:hypothetical protein